MDKRKINGKKIAVAVAIVLTVIAAVSAVTVLLLPGEKKNILSGIGKISVAKIGNEDREYSYYEQNRTALLDPYTDHQCGIGIMAEVIVPYAECTDGSVQSNRSDPLCSPLVRGTVDRVVSVAGDAEDPVYCLESGVKVNDEYLKITENAFLLPDNTLSLRTCTTVNNGIQFKLDTLWAVPVQVQVKPQEYYVGYQERPYNVSAFTGEYLDIRFARTFTLDGKPDFSESDIIKSCEWFTDETGGTLRLNFRKAGVFSGYSYSLDKNGVFVFTIKRSIRQQPTPVVMLDPGHGGSDPGAEGPGGEAESGLNLDIAEKAARILAEKGVKVVLTRRSDVDVSLADRLSMIRKYSPSVFVAIHCDSSESDALFGTHTFYYKSYSRPLGESLVNRLALVYGELYLSDLEKASASNRGTKFYPFAVTRCEECPAVLTECGYLTNPDDLAFLLSEQGRMKIAEAIAAGILEQLNVETN